MAENFLILPDREDAIKLAKLQAVATLMSSTITFTDPENTGRIKSDYRWDLEEAIILVNHIWEKITHPQKV